MATSRPRVHLVATGGTISYISQHRLDYYQYTELGTRMNAKQSLSRIPEVEQFARVSHDDALSMRSASVGPREWLKLTKHVNSLLQGDPGLAGVVVTHGTATLEETAYFLNLTLKDARPVVITGAMRPASALATDTDLNILDSIKVAAHPKAAGKGVLIVLNNEINAAREAVKVSTSRLETFKSDDLGFLGYADGDGAVVFYRAPLRKHTIATEFDVSNLNELPRVDIVYSYGGADGTFVEAALKAGAKGIVVVGYGSGSLSDEMFDAAARAVAQGVVVVRASRSLTGRVVMTPKNQEAGLLASDNLPPQKARILLMLALAVTSDRSRIQEMFYQY